MIDDKALAGAPKAGYAIPRALVQDLAVDFIRKWSSAPYGVLTGFRSNGRGKARTVTFGIARRLDAVLVIWSASRLAIEYNDAGSSGTFHSNRHSFTTRMIQVADLATARSFTGHSNAAMVAYYSHASADSRKAAMERLYGPSVEPFDLFELFQDVRDGLVEYDEFAARIRALWSKNGQP